MFKNYKVLIIIIIKKKRAAAAKFLYFSCKNHLKIDIFYQILIIFMKSWGVPNDTLAPLFFILGGGGYGPPIYASGGL